MDRRKIVFHALAVLAFAAGAATSAHAQPRTFVASFGSDTNVCTSPLTPCRTFQAGHDQVGAHGEVVALDSAGFGAIVINKSVTLIGTGVSASLTASAGDAVKVAAPGLTVALRDLRIQGLGSGDDGIDIEAAGTMHIQGCTIERFPNRGIEYTANGTLVIRETVVRDSGGDGMNIVGLGGTVHVTIDNSLVERNGNDGIEFDGGVIVAAITDTISSHNVENGFEGDADGASRITITRSTAAHNGGDGFQVGREQMTLEWSTAHRNGSDGMALFDTGTMRVSNSVSTNNVGCGFRNAGVGGTFASRGNNTVRGNTPNTCGTISALGGT